MTDKMYKVDYGKAKEALRKKLEEHGPEYLTKGEMLLLHSNRAERRKAGIRRQNVIKDRKIG